MSKINFRDVRIGIKKGIDDEQWTFTDGTIPSGVEAALQHDCAGISFWFAPRAKNLSN